MSIILDPVPAVVGDTFRIVTRTPGGVINEVLDLNDGLGYIRDRDAGITYTPAPPTVQYSHRARRFGGAQAVGVTHDNASFQWTAYIRGSSDADARERVEALLEQVEAVSQGRYLEWGPAGGTSSYLRIAGPGTWQPTYTPREFAEANAMRVAITLPLLPLVEWAPMTIVDPFATDTSADYTYDALTPAADLWGSAITGATSLTSERRLRHTCRGYQHQEGQAFAAGYALTMPTGYKLGVLLRANASSYVEVYTDNNGTNVRLRIDVILNGVRTNRSSTNLAAGPGPYFRVGGRIEGQTVYAEYWNRTTSFMPAIVASSTADNTASYTLTSPEQIALPSHGDAGFSWVPQNSSTSMLGWSFAPMYRRNITLPSTLTLTDTGADRVPGNAPALADVTIATSGGTSAPAWAYLGWGEVIDTAQTRAPLGVVQAEAYDSVSGWSTSVQAGASNGSDIRATTSGAGTYNVKFLISPGAIAWDDLSNNTLDIEVFARVLVTSTLANPTLTLSYIPWGPAPTSGLQYSAEYGTAGKQLILPSTGTVYRPMRLGTITISGDTAYSNAYLSITGSVLTGSAGAFGLDYIWMAPARSRALSPTGKPRDSSYPSFVASTSLMAKRIRSDLSAALEVNDGGIAFRDHGLGGSILELPPGDLNLLMKLSSLVPDDPTVDATTEQTSHTATVRVDVTPRSYMLRDT